MPANERYLSTRLQRISKTLAGIIGGYFVTVVIHLVFGAVLGTGAVWIQTTTYSAFSLWITTIIVALLFEKAWKVWGLYLLIIIICSGIIYGLR
ncbi:hypothetical protein [Rhodohalobacter sp. 614A]|uniref:hypothetical protein n=1 Tax=Rhodohalobacter sp. 614A TaxID=2908649 RepID=UPI001F27741A|nr:hypothetical protein [Rhodohalobacter sp. 614A]